MKTLARLFLRLCFGFKAEGTAALQTPGPVLLIPNHSSWLDWLFLYAVLDSDWKFVTSSATANSNWILRRVMINRRTFPVDPASPYAVKAMAEHLERGGRLVLFAEGRITLTGSLMKIYDGTGFLIRRTNAAVVTCYLRGANRLRFVRHHGWRKWFPRVSAHFSAPQHAPDVGPLSAAAGRQRLATWLRDAMVRHQFDVEMTHGPRSVIAAVGQTAAAIPGRVALEDFTFQKLSYRRLMAAADVLAGLAARRLAPGDGGRVGVLLPNVNAQPAMLLGLWEAGLVPAMLNYSTGVSTLLQCAQLAGLRSVVTSRAFLPKARLDPEALVRGGLNLIFLEDLAAEISGPARWTAFARNLVSCGGRARGSRLTPDDTAIVLFTSGSEGVPKGVELTHRNLLANIRQAAAVIDVTDDDRFFNALPLFHSFGLTGGTLFPLVRGCPTFLYPSPLHYRIVPALVYDRACTVLLGTNTFLNGYARKAHAYDFNSVRYLIAGAEKVQSTTFETWAQKFGVRILEGYGATECSPLISLNTRMEPGPGTAGRLVPGMEARIEQVDGVEDGGRLFVRGPNVMKGYLNPDANARFQAQEGWYDTGDIVHLDDEGYLHIRGRLKRFAKVSGEMVSLTAVEDALAGPWPQYGVRCQVAVVAVPDDDKGEKLVAITNEPRLALPEIRAAVRARGLSNLCAPREVKVVRSIPKLGTGKTDHRALQRLLSEQPAAAN